MVQLEGCKHEYNIHGHATWTATSGSMLGLMFCCHYLEILNTFWIRNATFSFFAGLYKFCSRSKKKDFIGCQRTDSTFLYLQQFFNSTATLSDFKISYICMCVYVYTFKAMYTPSVKLLRLEKHIKSLLILRTSTLMSIY